MFYGFTTTYSWRPIYKESYAPLTSLLCYKYYCCPNAPEGCISISVLLRTVPKNGTFYFE